MINTLTEQVIGGAIEVHRAMGPGLLESAYEECLAYELGLRRLACERQKPLPLRYKGLDAEFIYRMDLVVEGRLVLELKAVESLIPVHEAQLLTYLRLSGIKYGLLLNFHAPILKDGLRRFVV